MLNFFAQGFGPLPDAYPLMNFDPSDEADGSFALISILLILLSGAVLFLTRRTDLRLVILGILIAMASVGYSSLIPSAVWTAPSLMRIGVILILCGAGYALFNYPASGISETRAGEPIARPASPVTGERTGDVLP